MSRNNNKNKDDDAADVYFIPPNYVDSSGVFGGMFRLRNAVEACVIGGSSFWLLFSVTAGMDLTIRVIILLAVVLPLMFFAAIGVMGLSITEFIYFFFRFLFKRRIVGRAAFDTALIDGFDRADEVDKTAQESKLHRSHCDSKLKNNKEPT